MKNLDGRPIEVQLGSGSTLYVCNFPAIADEAWIRAKFREVNLCSFIDFHAVC